jgi:hypothetical protein
MLSLGYAVGSIARFAVAYFYFTRDFGISRLTLRRLVFESFAASVIGGAVCYSILNISGSNAQINTAFALLLESTGAGAVGLFVTGAILWLLHNNELSEAISALRRRFIDAPQVALEPSDVS